MIKKAFTSVEELHQYLVDRYEYSNGELISKKNKRPVGSLEKRTGRMVLCLRHNGIVSTPFLLHRLIFLLCTGQNPEIVDHINQNKLDNRIENLRGATQQQNLCNRGPQKNNTSGYKGVSRSGNGFAASICCKGVVHRLGTFPAAEEASAAYQAAAKELHGDFASS